MSMRMGSVRMRIKRRWGIMSSGGIEMGNFVKTGSNAVEIGTASSMLDGWGLVSVFMSLVARMRIRNIGKRANSA